VIIITLEMKIEKKYFRLWVANGIRFTETSLKKASR